MKNKIQYGLQKTLGYKNYLLIFSIYKYLTMRYDKRLKDFFYFLKIVPKEKAILDIGANLGYMSLLFSKKVGKNKVASFEPVKDNYSVLLRIVKIFRAKNILTFNYALGEIEDDIYMITPIVNGVKKQGLSQVSNDPERYPGSSNTHKVSQKKLDSISEVSNLKIGAIKIDVEGYEHFVLKGGISLIKENKPIIFCELWEEVNFTQCTQLLLNVGYNIFYYKNEKLVPYQCDKPTKIINFFFIHRDQEL